MKTSYPQKTVRFSMVLTLLAAFTILPEAAHAVILAQYDFTGSSLNSSDSSADSTASSFITTGFTSVINVSIGNPAPAIFAQGNATDSNFPIPAPQTNRDDFSFTVTPIATSLDYGTLTMDVRTMTADAASFYFSLQTSLNLYATNISTYTIVGSASTMVFQSYSFDLSAFAASSVVEEFRIVIHDSTSSASRGLVFDNVTLSTVPEPATAVLILGALAAGILIRRRFSRQSGNGSLS
jgi:hypothetical protein